LPIASVRTHIIARVNSVGDATCTALLSQLMHEESAVARAFWMHDGVDLKLAACRLTQRAGFEGNTATTHHGRIPREVCYWLILSAIGRPSTGWRDTHGREGCVGGAFQKFLPCVRGRVCVCVQRTLCCAVARWERVLTLTCFFTSYSSREGSALYASTRASWLAFSFRLTLRSPPARCTHRPAHKCMQRR